MSPVQKWHTGFFDQVGDGWGGKYWPCNCTDEKHKFAFGLTIPYINALEARVAMAEELATVRSKQLADTQLNYHILTEKLSGTQDSLRKAEAKAALADDFARDLRTLDRHNLTNVNRQFLSRYDALVSALPKEAS